MPINKLAINIKKKLLETKIFLKKLLSIFLYRIIKKRKTNENTIRKAIINSASTSSNSLYIIGDSPQIIQEKTTDKNGYKFEITEIYFRREETFSQSTNLSIKFDKYAGLLFLKSM